MTIFNLIRIAAKNLKGRWAVLPVAGIAICMFCFCFAGAIMTTVQQEKSLPYELNIVPGATTLSDSVLAEISMIPNVTAATPILEVPVIIKTSEYAAQMTMTGIDADYLEAVFSEGNMFPADSIMPYIVLNETACEQFSSGENKDEMPDIDWLGTSFYVQISEEGRAVASKMCGILYKNEEEQMPAAYISLSVAKDILRQNGLNTEYVAANVRVANIGCADRVSQDIEALGLSVANANTEQQAGWDAELKEMIYLIVIGAFCLLCSAVLMAVWKKTSLLEQKEAFTAMRWIGMKDGQITRLFMLQSAIIALFGIAVGIIISVSLPSFLSAEINETSILTMPIHFGIAALSSGVCIIAGLLPYMKIWSKNVSDFY